MTRILFGFGWLITGVFIAATLTSSAQQRIQVPIPGDVDPRMPAFSSCAKECDDCARSCEMSVAHCGQLIVDGRKEQFVTQRMCQDCAAICSAASRIIAKDGPFTDLICSTCIEACGRCAVACEKSGDAILKKCADDCRKCEKACRDMPKPARTPNK